jgi:hypothetical protein
LAIDTPPKVLHTWYVELVSQTLADGRPISRAKAAALKAEDIQG